MTFWLFSIMLLSAILPASGRPVIGAVDTDVNPDDAVVYWEGQPLGPADAFDGWPDHLYLPAGTHVLEFVLDGYEVFKVEVKVEPWQTVRIEKQLARVPPSAVREPPPAQEENPPPLPPPPAAGTVGTARLALTVSPEIAVIYVNDRFLIHAEDLARIHSPLQIPAGTITLFCYAPGYEESMLELDAEPGELIEEAIVLVRKR